MSKQLVNCFKLKASVITQHWQQRVGSQRDWSVGKLATLIYAQHTTKKTTPILIFAARV